MAKSFITGAARGPSTEEFKARMARLAPEPRPEPGAPRAPKAKSFQKPRPPETPPPDSSES
ncbi:hypothetical protein [Methylobacterium sp. JK268]